MKYTVTWRSSVMSAPAFWEFESFASATEAAETIIRRGGTATVRTDYTEAETRRRENLQKPTRDYPGAVQMDRWQRGYK
jgi:hypothetical protein